LTRDIKELRTLTGWSQSKLALKSGVDRSRLSFIENGYVTPSPAEQTILERVLLAEIARREAEFRAVVAGTAD
jgi:transcriptional regulator with XRE-family HTH domain